MSRIYAKIVNISRLLIKLIIFVVNYDSSHGKFFEFDLVSAGKVVLKRGKLSHFIVFDATFTYQESYQIT